LNPTIHAALPNAADQLSIWCNKNGMITNTKKTKESLIYFGEKFGTKFISQLIIHEKIERVSTFELLGVIMSSDLSREPLVSNM
jgi:hypothetical protein